MLKSFTGYNKIKLTLRKGHAKFGSNKTCSEALRDSRSEILEHCPQIWMVMGAHPGTRRFLARLRSGDTSPWVALSDMLERGHYGTMRDMCDDTFSGESKFALESMQEAADHGGDYDVELSANNYGGFSHGQPAMSRNL